MQPLLQVLLRDCWFKYRCVFWMIKHQSSVSKLLLCYIFLFIEQHLFQGPNCVVIEVQAAKFQLPNCCPVYNQCLKWQVQVSKVLLERASGCKRKPNLVLLYDASMLEHLHWCLVCDLAKIFLTSKLSFFSPPILVPTHKTKTETSNRWETTNSNPPGAIKLSSRLTVGVRLCCAFYQLEHPVQKY
jgi:hypothetical protein